MLWISLAGFLTTLAFSLQIAALPDYLSASFVDVRQSGIAIAAFSAGIVIARMFGLSWLDKPIETRAIGVGTAFAAVGIMCILAASPTYVIWVGRFLFGVGNAIVLAILAGVASRWSKHDRDTANDIAQFYSATAVALVAGPPLGLLASSAVGFAAVPALSLACSIIVALTLVARREILRPRLLRPEDYRPSAFRPDRLRLQVLTLGALTAAPVGVFETIFPYLANDVGIDRIFVVYLAFAISNVFGRAISARPIFAANMRTWAALGVLECAVSFAVVCWHGRGLPIWTIAMLAAGAGLGLSAQLLTNRLATLSPRVERARSLSVLVLAFYFVFAASSVLGGTAYAVGQGLPLLAIAIFMLALSAAIYVTPFNKTGSTAMDVEPS
ncbi:MAG: MFS transporter [Pseudomonadota bacterium]